MNTKIFTEMRLLFCNWCFSIALWLAPQNDPEGLIIIETIRTWAIQTKSYIYLHRI